MALKLGKCRLCLKLGDFYSIFAADNDVQLSEMVMECSRIKVYDGDGLPDKACSECIQKLSSAYIFKQQCERSDQELRRNYVPPPGFSISPPPPTNRQSSDSAFSTQTDSSNLKSSFIDNKVTPVSRNRKRSVESDNASIGSRSQDYSRPSTKPKPSFSEKKATPVSRKRMRSVESDASIGSQSQEYSRPSSSKRVEELRKSQKPKRPRYSVDSDYEDNGASSFVNETDSDEPLLKNEHTCPHCPKTFKWLKSMKIHMAHMHTGKRAALRQEQAVNIPIRSMETPENDDDQMKCDKCGKTFKLKIMLKRHQESCQNSPAMPLPKSPMKELVITLEPIDAVPQRTKKPTCEYCTAQFKTFDNLEKHLRVVHAATRKKDRADNARKGIICLYCSKGFDDYYVYSSHFNGCPMKENLSTYQCPMCPKSCSRASGYANHVKNSHYMASGTKTEPMSPTRSQPEQAFECRMCSKKLATQALLITHLAAHMSNVEDDDNAIADADDFDSREDAVADDSMSLHSAHSSQASQASHSQSGPAKCRFCDKEFTYRKSLISHELKHTEEKATVKVEPPDKPASADLLTETNKEFAKEFDSESSQDEGEEDNTCDICEKQFSYKRLLIQHKRTKHTMVAGMKRAKISLKDCSVRCLICDEEMKVSAINEHNQKHISVNIRPRNIYTCAECAQKFKSCSNLANHIKLVHRLKQQEVPKQFAGVDMADFCEVVVTKAEPLDESQTHNGFGEVPLNAAPTVNLTGFTCPICGKKMPTLVSLKRHVNWHSFVGNNLEGKHECFVCKETFKFKGHFKIHMRDHFNDTNLDPVLLTCTICQRKSKHLRAAQAHMNWHKQTRFQTKDYQCSICKRVFQYRRVYLSHMAIHYKKGESGQNTIVGDMVSNNQDPATFDGTFTCHLCGKVCDSENSLKCHSSWHRSKTLLYGARHECQMCHLQFTNKRHLELHTRSHYEDPNGEFKCNICGKGFIDEEYHRRHVKGHNFDHQSHKKRIEKLRKGKVKCPICNRYYPDLVKLIRHLRRTHPESKMIKEDPDAPPQKYYSCKLCAKSFYDEKRFKRHEESHLRKPSFFKCKFCGHKTMSMKGHHIHIKTKHMTKKYVDNPLKCTQCDEVFIWGYALHHHLRDVHGINETWIAERTEATLEGPLKDLQCSVCLKVLASKGNFERHIDYHNTLRCNYCFEYFSTLRFLEGHLAFTCDKKTLIGDADPYPKRVKCELCYKAFSLQVKLDCHLRIKHDIKVNREQRAGKQELVCDYCFKVFENEHALSGHKVYHRTIGYFGCIYCPRKFNTQTGYRKHKNYHLAVHNVDNPTKCEHCDETFVQFREMIYHMRDVHDDDKEWIVMPKDSIEEKCTICNKTFFNLHRHMDYHEENKCKKCSEYFYSSVDFDNHLCAIESDNEEVAGVVDPGRPYEECKFCFKPITKKDSKKKHDILHGTSGAISCRFCHLKFKTLDAFNIHSFSHRSRKYNKKPIKCRVCKERFVKYGPFIKHMRVVHKCTKKTHYRAVVKPERCVICGESFPNLHNHYRAHLANQCQFCSKYFTSSKLFAKHQCNIIDEDHSKVFTSDENVSALINSYTPRDLKDDEKFYGYTDDDEEVETDLPAAMTQVQDKKAMNGPTKRRKKVQVSQEVEYERDLHMMVQSPIISDVLSLFQTEEDTQQIKSHRFLGEIVSLTDDDDSMDMNDVAAPIVVIDD